MAQAAQAVRKMAVQVHGTLLKAGTAFCEVFLILKRILNNFFIPKTALVRSRKTALLQPRQAAPPTP
jgi:hypothetical protein